MVGVALVLLAASTRSIVVFFIGTAISGAGFGGGFQGSLRAIVPLAAPNERAGVISVAYIVCYLAMGLPAILAGVLVVNSTVLHPAQEFGIAVIVLAALTVAGMTFSTIRARIDHEAAWPAAR
jgi:predicted MFS family arabinose efflux permease